MAEIFQTDETFQPGAERVIADLETLRVIADPLRMQIMEVAMEAPRTVKQLATTLRVPASKLYYHINTLEDHGLLRVVGTRLVSGIVEKQYRAAVTRLRFDRQLVGPEAATGREALELMLRTALDSSGQELIKAVEAGIADMGENAPSHRKPVISKTLSRLTPERAAEFRERLRTLVEEFGDDYGPDESLQAYGLTILLHPMLLSPPSESSE